MKDVLKFIKGIVAWCNSHKAYGIGIVAICIASLAMSAYSVDKTSDTSTRLESIDKRLDTIDNRMDVIEGKLDVIISIVKEK